MRKNNRNRDGVGIPSEKDGARFGPTLLLAAIVLVACAAVLQRPPNAAAETRVLFQPDGRTIASVPPNGGQTTLLFHARRGSIGYLTASSDGRTIAFLLRERVGNGPAPDDVTDEIWVMRGNGTGAHPVRRFLSKDPRGEGRGRVYSLDISANGSKLVLTRDRTLYTMDVSGRALRRISIGAKAFDPEFDPTGRRIVLTFSGAEVGGIGTVDLRDGALTPVGRGGDYPTYSDDGQFIAFTEVIQIAGPCSVWIMNRDGSGARMVDRLHCEGDLTSPDFAPNGHSLLFVHEWKYVQTVRRDGTHESWLKAATYPDFFFYNLTPQWTR